eukprot:COSAG01_NODE_39599_length_474_cov_1.648000_1_plen_113_part_00
MRVLLLQAQLQVALEQLEQLRALHRQATSACRRQLPPAAAVAAAAAAGGGGGGGGGGEVGGATAQEVARLRSALTAEEARVSQLSATLREKELELAATRCGGRCVLFGGRFD